MVLNTNYNYVEKDGRKQPIRVSFQLKQEGHHKTAFTSKKNSTLNRIVEIEFWGRSNIAAYLEQKYQLCYEKPIAAYLERMHRRSKVRCIYNINIHESQANSLAITQS